MSKFKRKDVIEMLKVVQQDFSTRSSESWYKQGLLHGWVDALELAIELLEKK